MDPRPRNPCQALQGHTSPRQRPEDLEASSYLLGCVAGSESGNVSHHSFCLCHRKANRPPGHLWGVSVQLPQRDRRPALHLLPQLRASSDTALRLPGKFTKVPVKPMIKGRTFLLHERGWEGRAGCRGFSSRTKRGWARPSLATAAAGHIPPQRQRGGPAYRDTHTPSTWLAQNSGPMGLQGQVLAAKDAFPPCKGQSQNLLGQDFRGPEKVGGGGWGCVCGGGRERQRGTR